MCPSDIWNGQYSRIRVGKNLSDPFVIGIQLVVLDQLVSGDRVYAQIVLHRIIAIVRISSTFIEPSILSIKAQGISERLRRPRVLHCL